MMPESSVTSVSVPRRSIIGVVFRILTVFDTIALLFAASLHVAGVRIPLGSAVFVEPQMVPAAIVEGLAGVFFAGAAYAVFAGRRWAWSTTLFAHVFAILGFLVGIFATRDGTSTFNHTYHFVMLGIFVIGLALLLQSGARAALGQRSDRGMPGA